MVLVTELQYYLHQDLKQVIDLCIKRRKKSWDNLIIIDGMERAGKTTLGKTIGHYYASQTGAGFSLKNVFFDADKLIDFAKSTRNQVIQFDEAAFGGMSKQWQNKVQQKLIQMLMTCGKYGHFYIFIIPSFFELVWYLAVHRSIALIHVYSEDLISRGDFALYNLKQKKWIYNQCRKSETYPDPTFVGNFTIGNSDKIWDEAEYERIKDVALEEFFKEENKPERPHIIRLKMWVVKQLTSKQACELFKIDEATYRNWKKLTLEGEGVSFGAESEAKVLRSLRKMVPNSETNEDNNKHSA